jgi:hypothetical protein
MLFICAVGHAGPPDISQDTFSGRTYFHLLFKLTPTNSSLRVPSDYINSNFRPEKIAYFDDSGLFEVFIKASDFPVPSPGCDGGWIVLRMASTPADDSYADEKIEAKRKLWDHLQKMYEAGTGSADVAIELNPYVRVIDASVPKLELEYCNVFFRQAHGEYIPYVGALIHTNDFPPEELPTAWPSTDPSGWAKGTNSYQLLRHWFNRASKKRLGTEEDIAAIKKMILDDMKSYENPAVEEIRWLSPTLIIAVANWYSSPMGAGAYYYILEKKGSAWKETAHYLIAIA